MKSNSKDYIGIDTVNDFNQRMLYYNDVYQQFNIDEIKNLDNYSYLQFIMFVVFYYLMLFHFY